MKKYLNIIYILLLVSCGDFLEQKSQSEYVPKDIESLNEIILGSGYMHHDDRHYTQVFTSILDDDLTCSNYSNRKQNADFYEGLRTVFSWEDNMTFKLSELRASAAYSTYKNLYIKILGTNAVIDHIDKVSGTNDKKNIVKGQAFALRAFYHFQLVNLYGEPYNYNKNAKGIVLKLTSALEIDPKNRNTVEEVYNSIISDLKDSEKAYLEVAQTSNFRKDYRTSLPMVRLLLSRVFMYMEKWEEAAKYAKMVIEDNRFKLINLNTLKSNLFNFISFQSPEVIWLYGNPMDAFYFVGERWYYPENSYNTINIFAASPELVNMFDIDNDLRAKYYLVKQKRTTFYAPYSKIEINSRGFYRPYMNFARAFRLSEAYLNTAESEAFLYKINGNSSHKTKAIEAINNLRAVRYKEGSNFNINPNNADELIKLVRDERRKELFFEGHRWFDLRRYGMPEIKHIWHRDSDNTDVYTLNEKDRRYTLDIPQEAIILNPNLNK